MPVAGGQLCFAELGEEQPDFLSPLRRQWRSRASSCASDLEVAHGLRYDEPEH